MALPVDMPEVDTDLPVSNPERYVSDIPDRAVPVIPERADSGAPARAVDFVRLLTAPSSPTSFLADRSVGTRGDERCDISAPAPDRAELTIAGSRALTPPVPLLALVLLSLASGRGLHSKQRRSTQTVPGERGP